jgi:hypothetical protein
LNYAHANGMNELTSEAVFQQPKETTLWQDKVRTKWCMVQGINSNLDVLCQPVQSSRLPSWPLSDSALLSDMLHYHHIITIHHHQITVNFNGEKSLAHNNQITWWISSWDWCCCRCTSPYRIWMTLVLQGCC